MKTCGRLPLTRKGCLAKYAEERGGGLGIRSGNLILLKPPQPQDYVTRQVLFWNPQARRKWVTPN